jgi:predicted nucleotidyltransferase component of viral defense system
MSFHPEILQGLQAQVLRQLSTFASLRQFYLGGGTALAVHLGHRYSIDFDWFTQEKIADPLLLAQDLRDAGFSFTTGSVERGTLHGMIEGVRVSFMEYHYALLEPLVSWPEFGCNLASPADLACMKLSAVSQRGGKKDFIDIYALGSKTFSLQEMISMYQRKYSVKDISHLLYGLAFFDDAEREPGPKLLWDMDWKVVKKSVQGWVREVAG